MVSAVFHPMKEVLLTVARAASELSALDFRSSRWVFAQHNDGTQLLFRSAFIRYYIVLEGQVVEVKRSEWNQDYDPRETGLPCPPLFVGIFSEHQGQHVFSFDGLNGCVQLQEIVDD